MSFNELRQPQEYLDWTPSITVRAHHIKTYMGSNLRRLLMLYSPINMSKALALVMRHSKDETAYTQDMWGIDGANYTEHHQKIKSFQEEFNNLPDSTIVKIGILKDAICNACSTGKHCTATNYVESGILVDVLAYDGEDLKRIHKRLVRKGFHEGIDFTLLHTTETFSDYQGEKLWSNSQQPIPKVIEYNALLVKMGALRRVI